MHSRMGYSTVYIPFSQSCHLHKNGNIENEVAFTVRVTIEFASFLLKAESSMVHITLYSTVIHLETDFIERQQKHSSGTYIYIYKKQIIAVSFLYCLHIRRELWWVIQVFVETLLHAHHQNSTDRSNFLSSAGPLRQKTT